MSDARTEERLMDLLAQRATEGLGPGETAELRRLLALHPDVDETMFDEAAAAFHLATLGEEEALPEHLRASVEADAQAHFAEREAGATTVLQASPAAARRWWQRPAPAWFAAAASLVLALVLWTRGPEVLEVPVEVERVVEVPPPAPPGPSMRRASLLEQDRSVVQREWTVLPEALPDVEVEGDVVWSPSLQEGYMRFRGLPANDPAERQYQLWIFDAERDERFPVDGGLFNVPSTQEEVIVPIDPNIPVNEATLFAITIEPSGGVMVSDREALALIAPVEPPEDD